jgi:hypothetical protein
VPVEWDFPRCGVRDLWRQWWIGDSVRQVPPLRIVTIKDVKHLDKRPIAPEEIHGRRGPNAMSRREATKVLSDMKYLINTIEQRLQDRDIRLLPNEEVTQRKINNMFAAVNDTFLVNARDVQKSWLSVVRDLREVSRQTSAAIARARQEEEDDDSYDGFYEY